MPNKERIYTQNAAQFKQLVSFIASLGKNYNAEREDLELSNLKIVLNDAELSLKEMRDDLSNLENAVVARENAFEDLQQIVIRLEQTLAESPTPAANDLNIKQLIEKLAGKSSAMAVKSASDKNLTKSAFTFSQLSYETQIGFFERLVHLLDSKTEYQPDEYDLTISSLHARLTDLREKNAEAVNAATALGSSRMVADEVFCDAESGLINIAEMVRQNILSAFGENSFEYLEIQNLKFEKNS